MKLPVTASQRPWRVVAYGDSLQCDIYDANGTPVCTMGHFSENPQSDAALIVDAVNALELRRKQDEETAANIKRVVQLWQDCENERDRLRDIVRRSLPFIEGAIDGVSTILGGAEMLQAAGEAPPKDLLEDFIADGRRVLREARAAIGEVAANG